ncbi:hypothetical protein SELSPUOL_02550 [Selenomonas sputigena ATCC 35185]|uniref:Uncharacterized protein n=1 Tax=Selenomonas sputigena (strain ATCC 35185 / DSM 20758 / CCUG 44933 / VPI D19B-28) TaxID=546271 RepID=C9LYI9_SELS3|nr:hypothetical protein SELSPUOL_02550 [Selenomonas sputigena ATCC 35185]
MNLGRFRVRLLAGTATRNCVQPLTLGRTVLSFCVPAIYDTSGLMPLGRLR